MNVVDDQNSQLNANFNIANQNDTGYAELFSEASRHDWPIDPEDEDYQRFHGAVQRLIRVLPASGVAAILRGPSDDGDFELCNAAQGVADGSLSEASGFEYACRVPGYTFEGFVRLIEKSRKELAIMDAAASMGMVFE